MDKEIKIIKAWAVILNSCSNKNNILSPYQSGQLEIYEYKKYAIERRKLTFDPKTVKIVPVEIKLK